ncbi:MAG: sulfite exporter TauE/SafE family protein [Pseudobdellovibrionaceae bacterium]
MLPHDVLVAALAFFSESLGTLSGFGSSTFFVPAASHFEKFRFVLVLTALLHCFGNVSKLALFRESFNVRLFLLLAVPSVIFTAIGAFLAGQVGTEYLHQGLGVFLILWALYFLIFNREPVRMPLWLAMALTALSGFCTGLLGTGGAIRGIALASLGTEAAVFVGLSAAIDLLGDILRAVIYVQSGFMDWSQWHYLPMLFMAAWCGTLIGKMILGRINQKIFERIVAVFVLLGGVAMLVEQ